MHKAKVTKEVVFLIVVGVLVFFLRLIKAPELFHFTYDESVFAFIGRKMFTQLHVPLIGGVTPFHVHLSPFFYWLSAVFLFISNFNPLGWSFISALLSSLTVVILYTCLKHGFGKNQAFTAVIIYSFSLAINIFDRHYWGLVFNNLNSVVIIFSLLKIIQKKYAFFIPLALILSLSFHADATTWIYIPVVILTLIKYKIPLIKNTKARIAFVIFLLSFLPMVIFDLRHNFVNIRGIEQYFSEAKESTTISLNSIVTAITFLPKTLGRILYISGDVDLAKEYSYCKTDVNLKLQQTSLIRTILSGVILLYVFFPKKRKLAIQNNLIFIIKYFLLITFFGVVLYAGILNRPFFEHYVSIIFIPFILITSILINDLFSKKKIITSFLLMLFIIINIYKLTKTYHSYGYQLKIDAIKWSLLNVKEDFSLDSLSSCYKYNGYRYLYTLFGREPVKSYVDQNFFWLYDVKPSESHPKKLVVMVAQDYIESEDLKKRYQLYKEREIVSQKFGELEVLIVDNTKGILYDF